MQMEPQVVCPRLPELLRALVLCCKDMAWPVRDAGCVAAGRWVIALVDSYKKYLPVLAVAWRSFQLGPLFLHGKVQVRMPNLQSGGGCAQSSSAPLTLSISYRTDAPNLTQKV